MEHASIERLLRLMRLMGGNINFTIEELAVEITVCCLFPFSLIFWFRQRLNRFFKSQGGEVNAYNAEGATASVMAACGHYTRSDRSQ